MDDYINEEVIEEKKVIVQNKNRAKKRTKTETHRSGPGDSGRRLYRMVAVSFGMLCVLQVTLNISLRLVYDISIGDSKNKHISLHKMNMTKERDQLQMSYNGLTKERDQLQMSYNRLTKERDQLQTSYNGLTKERDQLERERDNFQKKFEEKTCCSNGWMRFEGSCYYISTFYISTVKNTWDHARQDCLSKGADLAIIESKDEQMFINGLKSVSHVWIGLTDSVTEGTWKWVDGTPLTTPRYWRSGEPNGGGLENCVVVPYWSSGQGDWWDDQCSNREYWICEKGLL
uniref:C-type lectin domain-containing protein n=1 Tax=Oncorhynchus kisutch TaxID=8019 RepID=A0A8C7H2E0_ONCKI